MSCIILVLLALAGLATRDYMGLLGVLPQQRRARAAAAALDSLIAQPEFTTIVVAPIERDLGSTVRSLTDVQALLLHIRRDHPVRADFRTEYRRPPTAPSQTIAAWRDVIDRLHSGGFDVYAYPQLMAKGDRLLCSAITQRMLRFDELVGRLEDAEVKEQSMGATPQQIAAITRDRQARAATLIALHATFTRGTNPANYDLPSGPLDDAQRAVARALHVTRGELDMLFYLNQATIDMINDDSGA